MAGSQARDAQHMHIIFHSLAGRFGRGLEKRTDIHIKSDIGIPRRNHFGSTVVPVLSQLGDHDPGLAAFSGCKFPGKIPGFLKLFVFHRF